MEIVIYLIVFGLGVFAGIERQRAKTEVLSLSKKAEAAIEQKVKALFAEAGKKI